MKDREDLREVPQEQAREFARKNNVAFFLETSAKTGENVQQVFLLASKLLYQNNKEIISDMVSLSYLFRNRNNSLRNKLRHKVQHSVNKTVSHNAHAESPVSLNCWLFINH